MMDQPHIGYRSRDAPRSNIKPRVQRVSPEQARKGGYIFTETDGVVVMEAPHYFAATSDAQTTWTTIPVLSRTLGAVSLLPPNTGVGDASLTYKMRLNTKADSVRVRIFFDATLPFKKGGHSVTVGFDGGEKMTLPVIQDLTWANNYSKMYPAAARGSLRLRPRSTSRKPTMGSRPSFSTRRIPDWSSRK